ncbi:AVB_G0025970.mRNA.1.CDS.1 [Saccharomyces cerevisiae]|nr:AVB_G0025970.mRNA.1.CDS.1 [Saccharomyces cerevisiae]CAI7087001.1 AVB_G0025970.mRNA.1.CDS.1 [Saccharomyces cerevisiae]
MFQAPTQLKPTQSKLLKPFSTTVTLTMLTGIAPDQYQNDHGCPMVLHQIKASYLQGSIQGRYLQLAN